MNSRRKQLGHSDLTFVYVFLVLILMHSCSASSPYDVKRSVEPVAREVKALQKEITELRNDIQELRSWSVKAPLLCPDLPLEKPESISPQKS